MGPRAAEVAGLLLPDKRLMPWQQHVLDVALEVDPGTGLPVYREVVLTVPRQSGKTTSLLCLMVHRALGFARAQRVTYTAQTRLAAREKWQYEHIPLLDRSPLRGMYRPVYQRGEERIVWQNGSIYGIESTTETAGHGNTLDLGIIDEAFARENAAGEQAMRPAMITRPDAQLWVVSTAGKSKVKSPYLWSKVEAGRSRADGVAPSSVAYFEWSAPVEADPLSPATWRECMPALGHTVTEAAVWAELESLDLAEFRRAYLNQWLDDVKDGWEVIPRAAWQARCDPVRPEQPFALSVACAWPDAEWTAIGLAGRGGDGRMCVDLADYRRGTSWVVERVVELLGGYSTCAVVLDAGGPAGSLVADFEAAGVELIKPAMREAAQAYGQFHAAVCGDSPSLAHPGHVDLDAAVAAAQRRPLADGWVWARKTSTDICPLEAVTLAAWGCASFGHLGVELGPDDVGVYVL